MYVAVKNHQYSNAFWEKSLLILGTVHVHIIVDTYQSSCQAIPPSTPSVATSKRRTRYINKPLRHSAQASAVELFGRPNIRPYTL